MLIVGGDSRIGAALGAELQRRTIPFWTTTRHRERCGATCLYCDLDTDISTFVPPKGHYAILCAGITNIEFCENNQQMTWHINVSQTLKLASTCMAAGYTCVLLSTNQVFDGTQFLPTPIHPTQAQTAYGRQKSVLEHALLQMQPTALVLRLSKVLPPVFPLFQQWRKAWQQGQCVVPFADMWIAPLALEQLITSILCLIHQRCQGIWHISPHEEWTYARVATYLAQAWGVDAALVQAGASDTQRTPLFRPRHVAMESSATWAACGLPVPSVVDALQQYLH